MTMLESFKINCFELNRSIRVTIHLPQDYYENNRFYPTIYFLDGQNLYESQESYRKTFELKQMIDNLHIKDKDAIYIGIWAASSEVKREQEYQEDKLANFIMKTIHSFLMERYRLNAYIYVVGCAKAAYTALKMNENSYLKGVILLSPELSSEQIQEISLDYNKLYYFYSGDECNFSCANVINALKEKMPNAHIIRDKNLIHNEEGWAPQLLTALDYLVL